MSLEKAAVSQDEHLHYHSRPKWHLFNHILDDIKFTSMNPKDTWRYKDETYGHTLQQYVTATGGKNNCQISAQGVLLSSMVNPAFPTLQKLKITFSLRRTSRPSKSRKKISTLFAPPAGIRFPCASCGLVLALNSNSPFP